MNIDPQLLAKVRTDIAALDFSTELAEIAEMEAEIAQCDEKIAEAQGRINELGELRRSQLGPSGASVANALLSGVDAKTAAAASTMPEQIDEEQVALRQAQVELNLRKDQKRRAIDTVRRRASDRAREAATPLAEAINLEAQAAAASIGIALAAFDELSRSFGGFAHRHALGEAVNGLYESRLLMRSEINLPEYITDLARLMAAKNPGCLSEKRRREFEANLSRSRMSEQEIRGRTIDALASAMAQPSRSRGNGRYLGGSVYSE